MKNFLILFFYLFCNSVRWLRRFQIENQNVRVITLDGYKYLLDDTNHLPESNVIAEAHRQIAIEVSAICREISPLQK